MTPGFSRVFGQKVFKRDPPELMLILVPPGVWLSIGGRNIPGFPGGCSVACDPSGWFTLDRCFSVALCEDMRNAHRPSYCVREAARPREGLGGVGSRDLVVLPRDCWNSGGKKSAGRPFGKEGFWTKSVRVKVRQKSSLTSKTAYSRAGFEVS